MSDISYKPVGKQDERLDYMKDMCKQAVELFLKAMEKMEYGMKFKAFDLFHLKEEEAKSLSDVISTAIAIELNKQAKDTLDEITYDCKLDKTPEKDGEYAYWIYAKREKPDWSKVPKMEETPIEDVVIPKIQDSESQSEKSEESVPDLPKVKFETLNDVSGGTHYTNAINYIV